MPNQKDRDYGFDYNDLEESMDSFSYSIDHIARRKVILNNGTEMKVYSDNTDEKTYDLYPSNCVFDPTIHTLISVPYSEVKCFV